MSIIVDAIITFLTWIFPFEQVASFFRRLLYHKAIDTAELEDGLKNIRLGVNNGEAIKNGKYIQGRSYIYFPVVPRVNLSIIHLVFADEIKGLNKLGLKARILVFDDYYGRVKKLDKRTQKTYIRNFVSEFTKLGIKRSSIRLQSNYLRHNKLAKKFLYRIFDLCSRITIDQINELRKSTSAFTKETDPYIRQQKIIYTLSFVSLLGNDIGFVLCGKDEVLMWEEFIKEEKESPTGYTSLSDLVILTIPKMQNSNGADTSIWDEGNLCQKKDREIIHDKIMENIANENFVNENCGIFYLLDHLHFQHGDRMDFNIDGKHLYVTNIKELIDEIKEWQAKGQEVPANIITVMTDTVFNILNNKKK